MPQICHVPFPRHWHYRWHGSTDLTAVLQQFVRMLKKEENRSSSRYYIFYCSKVMFDNAPKDRNMSHQRILIPNMWFRLCHGDFYTGPLFFESKTSHVLY